MLTGKMPAWDPEMEARIIFFRQEIGEVEESFFGKLMSLNNNNNNR